MRYRSMSINLLRNTIREGNISDYPFVWDIMCECNENFKKLYKDYDISKIYSSILLFVCKENRISQLWVYFKDMWWKININMDCDKISTNVLDKISRLKKGVIPFDSDIMIDYDMK